ncbi:hypothetical protein HT594_00106 [Phenacoccus solenopsis nudivirus]|nr:hypothetical protein HT594_00106 [Phenacoccus solenopsis nudivirus]
MGRISIHSQTFGGVSSPLKKLRLRKQVFKGFNMIQLEILKKFPDMFDEDIKDLAKNRETTPIWTIYDEFAVMPAMPLDSIVGFYPLPRGVTSTIYALPITNNYHEEGELCSDLSKTKFLKGFDPNESNKRRKQINDHTNDWVNTPFNEPCKRIRRDNTDETNNDDDDNNVGNVGVGDGGGVDGSSSNENGN